MRSILWNVAVGLVWLLPYQAAAQNAPPAEAKAYQHTITVKPSAKGCAVELNTKVAKALGTPEGMASVTQGETGAEPLSSIIACQCGPKVERQECPRGGTCACRAPEETPVVSCN